MTDSNDDPGYVAKLHARKSFLVINRSPFQSSVLDVIIIKLRLWDKIGKITITMFYHSNDVTFRHKMDI